jgi:hypothetical protein
MADVSDDVTLARDEVSRALLSGIVQNTPRRVRLTCCSPSSARFTTRDSSYGALRRPVSPAPTSDNAFLVSFGRKGRL